MVIFHGFPCLFVCLPEGNPPSHWFFEVEAPPAAPPQPVLLLSAPEKVLRRRAEVRKLRRRVVPNKAPLGVPGELVGGRIFFR